MAITVELSSGQRIVVESESATVGSDQSCDISLPDVKQLQPRHAQIRKVANKWMIESSGDWLL
jgi:pSer/pThr/pTyr-binding forkhead associated (FHA) protein